MTEEIRTHHGHHHRAVASWTDDAGDDDGDDDDDDGLASSVLIAIAPMPPHPRREISPFLISRTLGPSTGHDQLLERPPRTTTL